MGERCGPGGPRRRATAPGDEELAELAPGEPPPLLPDRADAPPKLRRVRRCASISRTRRRRASACALATSSRRRSTTSGNLR
eukprot:CAMPEP_0202053050 /NCGR_PEP_ID=MMETSP0963-20130614/5627_1 /ASSEMBLY_ACC=CAM_ASM_000494 /TAXON_ID=4773 /ORGANISM="Schizochytrium aggregatum, Strain ATCC28209" /LENGTH=81 /DNA_ID=CAMNT_0048618357 /DNA_START=378 /DNA_END=623 /DNA_ORIENTATION=+